MPHFTPPPRGTRIIIVLRRLIVVITVPRPRVLPDVPRSGSTSTTVGPIGGLATSTRALPISLFDLMNAQSIKTVEEVVKKGMKECSPALRTPNHKHYTEFVDLQ